MSINACACENGFFIGKRIRRNRSTEMAASVNVEKLKNDPAKNGAVEQRIWPKIQFLRNAVIGVIVPEVRHTITSEQLSENMNILGTVCRLLNFLNNFSSNFFFNF